MENLVVIPAEELDSRIQIVVTNVLEQYFKKDSGKKYVTRQQVATAYHISLPTVHAYINRGLLVAHKIGGRTLFEEKEVEQALTQKYIYNRKRCR